MIASELDQLRTSVFNYPLYSSPMPKLWNVYKMIELEIHLSDQSLNRFLVKVLIHKSPTVFEFTNIADAISKFETLGME